jgi:Na+/melibiose symporter-like transporter
MKLDNKRTVLVGLAFLSICAFWQMYDNVVPLILTNTFHLNETFSGAIMAADNVLALFLLPFFGTLSDRAHTKLGKRMPFILFGTGCAIILMNLLPLLDNSYAAAASPFKRASFVVVLGLLLVAMGTYRSPAVALMPDVTPKPLRSRANAIINLMGAVGGLLYLGVAAALYPNAKVAGLSHVDYQPLFLVVSAIMFLAVGAMFLTVREPKLTAENQALEKRHPEWNLATEDAAGHEVLPAPVKRSLGFLLASIALWFIGYNGVTTWFTTYVSQVMGQGLGGASTCLLIATAGAILSYIPIGALASKIGPPPHHPGRHRAADGLLHGGLLPHDRVQDHHARHVRRLRARGSGLGRHQRQQPADGRGRCAAAPTSASSRATTTRPPWPRRS